MPHQGNFVVHGVDFWLPTGRSAGDPEAVALAKILALDRSEISSSDSAAKGLIPPATTQSPTYELVPLVVLNVDFELQPKEPGKRRELDQKIYVTCVFFVHLLVGSKPTWDAEYWVEMPQRMSLTVDLDVQPMRADIAECLHRALNLYSGHVDGRLKPSGKFKIRTRFDGVFKGAIVESELPNWVVFPTSSGYVQVPKEFIQGPIQRQ